MSAAGSCGSNKAKMEMQHALNYNRISVTGISTSPNLVILRNQIGESQHHEDCTLGRTA